MELGRDLGLRIPDTELRRLQQRLEAEPPHAEASIDLLETLGLGERAGLIAGALAGFRAEQAASLLGLLLAQRQRRAPPRLELVWSGPEPAVAESRRTAVVLRHLFERSRRSVLMAGYRFDHGASILEALYRAIADRGVRATIFLDIDGEAPSDAEIEAYAAAQVDRFFAENWPFGFPQPVVYYDPRTASPTQYASLHAKCVVVDEAITLVTSANFTARAHERNVEVGVLIEDVPFSRRLVAHWMQLVAMGTMQARKE